MTQGWGQWVSMALGARQGKRRQGRVTAEALIASPAGDLWVQVQARGIVGGEPLIRQTTVKHDTEYPQWNEKIMFGPMPWDSGIAFQLYEEDTVWDDPIKLYIEGRSCTGEKTLQQSLLACLLMPALLCCAGGGVHRCSLVLLFLDCSQPPIQGPVTTVAATSGSGPG